MTLVTDERWLEDADFSDKRELFFKSRYLDREVALQDILSLHLEDLRKLMLEVEAEHALQGFHFNVNSQIEQVDPSHKWKEKHRRYAFKRFVLVYFTKAIMEEMKFREKNFALQEEVLRIARNLVGQENFEAIVSQANHNINELSSTGN